MTPSLPPEEIKPLLKENQIAPKWYAIYTHPRAEKLVFTRLGESGIETFLPLIQTIRKWSDRKKLVEKPLLSSYVFVKVKPKEFPLVYRTTGVVKFVSFEGQPVAIPQNQIDNLKLLINSDAEIEVTGESIAKGDNVEVVSGSLIGLTGELIKVKGKKRVVVRIDKLDQNIVITIPVTFLRKV
ncbi:MAG: UpxY family transcription antiterminator [Bacteroidales bacterium]|jgi:transcription antitermination factor NusG|nr:UpxY family transcription antiterminator [Bacteroidales bacterium]